MTLILKTKKQRRLAILKDAKKQLLLGTLKAVSGSYMWLEDDLETKMKNADPKESAQKFLLNNTEPCEVCAIGAMFIGQVRKENKVKLVEIPEFTGGMMRDKLNKIFSQDQLELFEAAFEGYEWGGFKFNKFTDSFPNDKDRLLAIINNAIKNGGILDVETLIA